MRVAGSMTCSTSSPIPRLLLVAWERVRTNRGARTAGVDGATAYYIGEVRGEDEFLAQLRADLKAGEFVALPVRERMIPEVRRQAAPAWASRPFADRVVQAALKLVLEPIFEADFQPCSYGFRPRRRAQDAIAEIHQFHNHGYSVGARGGHRGVFGCGITLLLGLMWWLEQGLCGCRNPYS